jgi:peptidoglycan-associated lipoprotein
MRISVVLVTTVIAGLASACGASPAPAPQAPSPPAPIAAAPTTETPREASSSGNVEVSTDILKACGLSDADAYFPFDSSRIEKQDIRPLNTIASCFSGGSLKGHRMGLVGHADPRGAPEYNMTLGQARADGVEGYLEKRGIDKGKVETSSRGAMDATGTSEAGWARDRRVDVILAQ